MRKIELELQHAVRSVLLGETSGWAKGNTIVTRGDGGSVQVFLHGNRLGVFTQDGEQGAFYHMGGKVFAFAPDTETLLRWPTNTTMSRLRALGVPVSRRKGKVLMGKSQLEVIK